MVRLWIAICSSLTFVSWASSDKVVLMQKPECSSASCEWTWDVIPIKSNAWSHLSSPKNYYITCDVMSRSQPNNWLRSDIIPVGEGKTLDVTVKYFIIECLQQHIFCNESFSAYVWESNTTINIPDPITSYSSYRRFVTFNRTLGNFSISTIPLKVNSKFIVLGFHDQGGCRRLYSVKVTYDACVAKTLKVSLVSLPQTLPPLRNHQSIEIEGSCATDSVQAVQGSMIVLCERSGEWNTSLLEGSCVCKENMENKGGMCEACPAGKYNDQKGLNCTGLPSAPRNTSVAFLNQSAAVIRWEPPQDTSESNHVFYDVLCRKPCNGDERSCIEEACPSSVSYIPSARLNETQVIVTSLSTYVNYTFKIYTKNRVSDLAGVDGNFSTISLLTMGAIPGKPELSVEQDEATVYVSWTLEDKNGIIKNYNVMYIRDDDSADMMNLSTNGMKQNFEDLRAGKTYEFQVYAVNNYGKGPPGVKKFKVRDGLHGGTADKLIVPVAAGGGGALLLIIVVVTIIVVFMLRRRKRNVERDYMRSIEHGGELDQRRYIDPSNYSDLTGILSTFTAEMERNKVKLEGIIGQGEFADVYKGTLKTQGSKDVVAVKVLRPGSSEKSQRDFLSEASIVAQFNHPNVIRLVGVVTKTTPMMILTEFLESGSLDTFLRTRNGQLTNLQLVGMARGVACGMVYLSEKNFIHRDLAARNILVGENMSCKVSDFGLSRELANDNPDSEYETQGGKIPVRWTAPEALKHRTFSSACDVWSYGILLWEIMSFSDRPYWDWNNRDVIDRVTTGYRLPPPEGCPKVVHKLMMECWESDKNTRPTFAEIVCHLNEIIRSPDSLNARSSRHGTSFVKKDAQGFESVKEWLISINMENYVEVFKVANIDSIEKVAKLKESDLREMGVKLIGHRNKMNKSIKSKRAQFANEGVAAV